MPCVEEDEKKMFRLDCWRVRVLCVRHMSTGLPTHASVMSGVVVVVDESQRARLQLRARHLCRHRCRPSMSQALSVCVTTPGTNPMTCLNVAWRRLPKREVAGALRNRRDLRQAWHGPHGNCAPCSSAEPWRSGHVVRTACNLVTASLPLQYRPKYPP